MTRYPKAAQLQPRGRNDLRDDQPGRPGRVARALLVTGCLVGLGLASVPFGDAGSGAEGFLARCAALAGDGSSPAVAGIEGWWFSRAELRHLGAGVFWGEAARSVGRASDPDLRDPLPAIVDLSQRLEGRGIALLVVPVPPKAVVYPDRLAPGLAAPAGDSRDSSRPDVNHVAFYRLLRQRGVAVLDLVPDMLAARARGGEPLYCRTDTHWSPAGCELAAGRIVGWIREHAGDRRWLAAQATRRYATASERLVLSGDLVRGLDPTADPRCQESVTIRRVGILAGDTLEPLAPDRASPVLVMADSHGLVFHAGGDLFASGAGLPDQLALELGFPVDLIAVRGSAASATRMSLLRRTSSPAYLDGKRVVIWCFAARELTESLSGWTLVPLERPSARSRPGSTSRGGS